STASRFAFRDDRDTPLAPRRDGGKKTHIPKKRKKNIFCERAGHEFGKLTCRANHLYTNDFLSGQTRKVATRVGKGARAACDNKSCWLGECLLWLESDPLAAGQ